MISLTFSSLFFLIALCLQNQVFSAPILIWNNVNLPQSAVPLSTLSSQNLISNYICQVTNKKILLYLLAVNDLSIEDIQHGPERNHPVLLEAKQAKRNFRFYPNVADDIFKSLSLIPQSNNLKCSHIQFRISTSKIYERLSDALDILQATIDTNPDNAVIIALVNNPSESGKLSRQRRQTASTGSNVLISNNNTCMFHAEQLRWNTANGTKSTGQTYTLDIPASSCQPNATASNSNASSITLYLFWTNPNSPFDRIQMNLTTTIIGRYWYLEKATINSTEYRYFAHGMHDRMVTPPTYSYVCNSATFVQYNSSVIHGRYNFNDKFYLIGLQFQPFYSDGLVFGAPNHCTSFFTSGIWMGIVSSLLCLGILLVGVCWMMSIKTNDRFDDPKGKPLLIKAQE